MILPPFDSVTDCPKCGRWFKSQEPGHAPEVTYQAKTMRNLIGGMVGVTEEVMERRCGGCGFTWLEEPKTTAHPNLASPG